MSADRNLLFGILALQMDFITRDGLVAAMHAWALDKAKPLGQILVEQNALAPTKRDLLEPLVDQHVRDHGGDPHRSLAALSSVGSDLRREFSVIRDSDLSASVAALGSTRELSTLDAPPESGLRYRVLRPHARGGLGEVFVAEDTEVHRHVALKEIQHRHADDPNSRGRFLLEAEITGRLEHPGIVPVYGLGVYDDGRPYYAMRFIKGDNLGEAIKRFHRIPPLSPGGRGAALSPLSPGGRGAALSPLSPGGRGAGGEGGKYNPSPTRREGARFDSLDFRRLLRRFLDVCNAVAYAHSRGVLHRDLKPGNIMLGEFGETLLVDWGLAKIVGRPESADGEATIRPSSGSSLIETVAGSAIGTPAYMSPEQAEGKLDELGPATDVYSLGATLYVLLTGRPPVEKGDIASVLEKVRRGDIAPPRTVQPGVPRPLEAVCHKAMALRPADRYATARALAADIEHWLADEPVGALAEPFTFRARRWMRRHPGTVAALAATLVVGVLGLGGGLYFVNAERNRTAGRAEGERLAKLEAQAAAEREKAARTHEERERKYAQAIADFVQNDFLALTSVEGQHRFGDVAEDRLDKDATLRQLLDRAAAKLDARNDLAAKTEADLHWMIGVNYREIGEFQNAIRHLERCLAIRRQLLGQQDPETLDAQNSLAVAYVSAGRTAEALPLHEEALRLRRAKLGPDHPQTLNSLNNLALGYRSAGRTAEALPLHEEALRLCRAKLGPGHPETLNSLNNLALSYHSAGRTTDALPLLEEALRLFKGMLGPDHPHRLTNLNNLAAFYRSAGRTAEALPLYEEALRLRKAKLGPDHPATLASLNNLALGYHSAGRTAEALPLWEEALRLFKAKLGPDHPDTLASLNNLAAGYQSASRTAEALPLFEEALRLSKAKLGPDHPDTLNSLNNLAAGYQTAGRTAEALPLFEEALRLKKAKLGPDHPNTLTSLNNLASGYQSAGRTAEALPLYEEALRLKKARLGPDHPDTLASLNNLASGYNSAGRTAEALPLYEEALRLMKARLGPDHPNTLTSLNNLASGYDSAGRAAEALPLYEEALRLRKAKLGPDHPDTLTSLNNLASGYDSAGRTAEALPLYEEASRGIEKRNYQHKHAGRIIPNTIVAYETAKQFAQAESWRRKWLTVVQAKAGAEAPAYGAELAGLSGNLIQQQKYTEAEAVLRECLAIREKKEPDAWVTFNTKSLLGGALAGQKKYADAEPLLVAGAVGLKQRQDKIPTAVRTPRLSESIERLVQLYDAWGKPVEAAKWRAELEELKKSAAPPPADAKPPAPAGPPPGGK